MNERVTHHYRVNAQVFDRGSNLRESYDFMVASRGFDGARDEAFRKMEILYPKRRGVRIQLDIREYDDHVRQLIDAHDEHEVEFP